VSTQPADQGASRQQIALVVGLLLVLLVMVYFFFLRGGGDAPDEAAPLPTTTAVEPPPDADVDEGDAPGGGGGRRGGPLETFDVFAPRDPFVPLIAAATTGGTTGETGGTADGDGTDGDGNGNGDGNGGGNGGNGGAPQTQTGGAVGGHTVKLMDVFNKNGDTVAQVQVDGTVYTVSQGETFAESFQVLSIRGKCATLLFGDDEFNLCEGEEILK